MLSTVTPPPIRIGTEPTTRPRGGDQLVGLCVCLAGENQAIGAAEPNGRVEVILQRSGHQGIAGSVVHIGENRDAVGPPSRPGPDSREGLRAFDPEGCDHGADVDLDADEIRSGRGGHGHHGLRVVLEQVQPDRNAATPSNFACHPRHPGHLHAGGLRIDRDVAEILHHQRVDAVVGQDPGFCQRGPEHIVDRGVAVSTAAGQRIKLHHPDHGLRCRPEGAIAASS